MDDTKQCPCGKPEPTASATCSAGYHNECEWLDCTCECHAPKLGQNESEAQRLAIGGRQIRSLKANRTYDTERLVDMPLFREKGRLF